MAKKIGELLIDRGLLTEAQLKTALRTQEFFGGHLGSIFLELGFLEEQALGEALAEGTGARYAPPEFLEDIPGEVHGLITAKMADKHKVFPLRVEARSLHLAMMNPRDLQALDEVRSVTGMEVVPYICPEFRVFEALARYYKIERQRGQSIAIDVPPEVDLATLTQAEGRAAQPAAPETAGWGGDVGLDGLPLDAEFKLDESYFASRGGEAESRGILEQLPRSPGEWRDRAAASPPAPAPTQAAHHASPAPSPPAAQPPTPVAAAPASIPAPRKRVTTLAENARRMLAADNRDEIATMLLEVTEQFFRRRLLFIVQRDRIVGWAGQGDRVLRDRVRKVVLPMDSLSLFTAVKVGSRPMIGPVADVPANRRLYEDLAMIIPPEVVLLPVRIKDRVVAIFYGDNGALPVGKVDVDLLRRFTLQASLALEILLLRGKLLAL